MVPENLMEDILLHYYKSELTIIHQLRINIQHSMSDHLFFSQYFN